jgi:transposase-like protein
VILMSVRWYVAYPLSLRHSKQRTRLVSVNVSGASLNDEHIVAEIGERLLR